MGSVDNELRRTAEIEFLQSQLSSNANINTPILFYGLPYIGKTTLRRQIISDVLQRNDCPFIDIDLRVQTVRGAITPERLITHMARLLIDRYRMRFPLLRIAASFINEDLPEPKGLLLAKSPKATDATDFIDQIVQAVQHIPYLGILSKLYKVTDHTINWLETKKLKQAPDSLRHELQGAARDQLTDIFVRTFANDFESYWEKTLRRSFDEETPWLIVLFDHLECLTQEDAEFILSLAAASQHLRCIIFSSNKGIFGDSTDPNAVISKEVEKLNFDTCQHLLASEGLLDPALQRTIFDLSLEGHPQFLGLAIDICRAMIERGRTPTAASLAGLSTVVMTPEKNMLSRLFSWLTEQESDLLNLLSLPRAFDQELISYLQSETLTSLKVLQRLRTYSFVREIATAAGPRYQLDRVVSTILYERFKGVSPARCFEIHQKLETYYAGAASKAAGHARGYYIDEEMYHYGQRNNDPDLRKLLFYDDPQLRHEFVVVEAASGDYSASRIVAHDVFGDLADSVTQVRQWYDKNPSILRVLKNKHNKVLGYTIILPLRKEAMQALVNRQMYEYQITANDILTPNEVEGLEEIYFSGIAVQQDTESHMYGAVLMRDVVRTLSCLQIRYSIRTVYATIMSEIGDHVARKLNFEVLWEEPPKFRGIDRYRFAKLDIGREDRESSSVRVLRRLLADSADIPVGTDAVLGMLEGVSRIEMEQKRIVGSYRRWDEQTVNSLKNWVNRISKGLGTKVQERSNFLIWAAPGTGKTFFIEEIAKTFGDHILFVNINFAKTKEEELNQHVNLVRTAKKPILVLFDEIDARPDQHWLYENTFSLLDMNIVEESSPAAVFVLIGSMVAGQTAMLDSMMCRPKGPDMVSRVPAQNRFEIPSTIPEDQLVIIASQLEMAEPYLKERVKRIEKLAAYYILKNLNFRNPRHLRDLIMSSISRTGYSIRQLQYYHLFEANDPEMMRFWVKNSHAAEQLRETFIEIG